MTPRHLLPRTWVPLALLASACSSDPCLDDGFRQDPPENCPSAAETEGETEEPATTGGPTGAETTSAAVPPCENGVLDPGEAGVDCGGQACPQNLCAIGYTCGTDEDCASQLCSAQGRCVAPVSCDDAIQNADETDVDCGGPECDPCDDGRMCALDSDCTSSVCDEMASTCSAPACDDGAANGEETDVDCGGPDCAPC